MNETPGRRARASEHCHDSQAAYYLQLITEFLGVQPEIVERRFRQEWDDPGSSVAQAWNGARPATLEEIERFYRDTDSYVYDLAVDHCRSERDTIWNVILQRIERGGRGRAVLAFGDGIGTDSIALARRGHSVTYYDLPGVTSRFAAFRFKHEGLDSQIGILTDSASIPIGAFDVVVCIEVLEHLPDPLKVMRDLVSYTRVGGVLLLTDSFGSVGPGFPSHLPANRALAGLTSRIMERFGVANTYYNRDPINYPMEFTRVRPGPAGAILRLACRLRRGVDTRVRGLALALKLRR